MSGSPVPAASEDGHVPPVVVPRLLFSERISGARRVGKASKRRGPEVT